MTKYSYYDNIIPELVYFVHRKCTRTWRIDEKKVDVTTLTYLLDGEAEYKVGGVTHKVTAGDLLCVPKGSAQIASTSPENLMDCYCISLDVLDLSGGEAELPFPVVSHIGIHPGILSLYRELDIEHLRQRPGYRMKIRGIILLILQRYFEIIIFMSNPDDIDGRIKKIIRSITDHYNENLRLNKFARQFGLNPAYLGTLFKKNTGMSFNHYLMEVRMNAAEDMLRNGGHNVSEVALSCGFPDVFYFSKTFKKSRGVLPSSLISKEKE